MQNKRSRKQRKKWQCDVLINIKVKFGILQEIPHTKHKVTNTNHDKKTVDRKEHQNTNIDAHRQTTYINQKGVEAPWNGERYVSTGGG